MSIKFISNTIKTPRVALFAAPMRKKKVPGGSGRCKVWFSANQISRRPHSSNSLGGNFRRHRTLISIVRGAQQCLSLFGTLFALCSTEREDISRMAILVSSPSNFLQGATREAARRERWAAMRAYNEEIPAISVAPSLVTTLVSQFLSKSGPQTFEHNRITNL